MLRISAVIITFNEERNILNCLESIKWADEIIVVDAFSTDKTVDIARRYTEKIFTRKWDNYSDQRNFGLPKSTNNWVLFIDADERVSEALAAEIAEKIDRINDGLFAGYFIPRISFYLGKCIKHGEWFPQEILRLIKKDRGKWHGRVHEKIILEGKVSHLKNPILHYTNRDIAHHVDKINNYSGICANEAFRQLEKGSLFKTIRITVFIFIKGYFLKRGFMDGVPGLVIAVMQSLEFFLRYAKLEELKIKNKS